MLLSSQLEDHAHMLTEGVQVSVLVSHGGDEGVLHDAFSVDKEVISDNLEIIDWISHKHLDRLIQSDSILLVFLHVDNFANWKFMLDFFDRCHREDHSCKDRLHVILLEGCLQLVDGLVEDKSGIFLVLD